MKKWGYPRGGVGVSENWMILRGFLGNLSVEQLSSTKVYCGICYGTFRSINN